MSALLIGPSRAIRPLLRPLLLTQVPAGFPSPADDYVDDMLDLNRFVEADVGTYYFRCAGDSMTGAGIFPGDVLVVQRETEPRSGDVVIAELDGEFTVKRWVQRGARMWLVPDSDHYPAIEVLPGHEMIIYGVVTHAVHSLRPAGRHRGAGEGRLRARR